VCISYLLVLGCRMYVPSNIGFVAWPVPSHPSSSANGGCMNGVDPCFLPKIFLV
jgi:hypothetical protein